MNRWTRAILGRPFDRARELRRAVRRAPAPGRRGPCPRRWSTRGSGATTRASPPRTRPRRTSTRGCGSSTPSITSRRSRAFREAARLDPTCAMCYWGIALTPGLELQQPDRRRARASGASRPSSRRVRWPAAPRTASGRSSRPARSAHADDADGRPRGARPRLRRRHARGGAALSRRPRRRHALRRRAHEPPAVGPVEAGRQHAARAPRRSSPRSSGCSRANPDHPGAHPSLHPRRRGRARSGARRGGRRSAGTAHARRGAHGPHARRTSTAGSAATPTPWRQRAGGQGRPRVLREGPEPSPISPELYYPHNLDFIWQAASMEGRSAETIRAAREFAEAAPPTMLREMPDMETAPAAPILRAGPLRPLGGDPARARAARGVAVRHRRLALLARPRLHRHGTPGRGRGASWPRSGASASAVPPERHARRLLQDQDDARPRRRRPRRRDRRADGADRRRRSGTSRGGGRAGRPLVHRAARLVLPGPPVARRRAAQRGRPAEAEAVYRDDLKRNPDNGWSLFGLAQSLRAQGKTAEAAEVEARFQKVLGARGRDALGVPVLSVGILGSEPRSPPARSPLRRPSASAPEEDEDRGMRPSHRRLGRPSDRSALAVSGGGRRAGPGAAGSSRVPRRAAGGRRG